jgi:TPR repeat protein
LFVKLRGKSLLRLNTKYLIFIAISIYPFILFGIIQSLINIDDFIFFILSLKARHLMIITISAFIGMLLFLYHLFEHFSSYRTSGHINSYSLILRVLLDGLQDLAVPLFILSAISYYVIHFDESSSVESLLEQKRYTEARSVAQIECSQRDGASCFHASELARDGVGGKRDLKKAHQLLNIACRYKVTQACARLGDDYRNLGRCIQKENIKDENKCRLSLRSYNTACEGGDLDSCFWVAYYTSAGIGQHIDRSFALKLYVELCESGHAKSCHYSSRYYNRGWGVAKDLDRYKYFKERSCELGYLKDCYR